MRMVPFTGLIYTLLVAFSVAHAADTLPVLPNDITANITIDDGGEALTGFLFHDFTGQRAYLYIKEMEQHTFTFQPFGGTRLFSYSMTTSGCTCEIFQDSKIQPYFGQLATATKSTNTSLCSKGTPYFNTDFLGLRYQGVTVVPTESFCVDETTTPATPVSKTNGVTTYTFSNIAKTRTSIKFPTEPLASMMPQCMSGCL